MCSTLFNSVQLCLTVFNRVQMFQNVFNYVKLCSTLSNATKGCHFPPCHKKGTLKHLKTTTLDNVGKANSLLHRQLSSIAVLHLTVGCLFAPIFPSPSLLLHYCCWNWYGDCYNSSRVPTRKSEI